MNIKGKLIEIYPTKQVTGTFQKREFVIEYADNPKYPQSIKFEFIQDNCGMLDSYRIGDNVDVSFDLTGRPWTNPQGEKTYFTTLRAWKLEKLDGSATVQDVDDFIPPGEEPPF